MTTNTIKERRRLRKLWKQINGAETSDVDKEGLFLLAASQVGPRKYMQIAALAGLSRSESLKLSRKAREVGLFKNKQIMHSGWDQPDEGGLAFIMDVLVLAGTLERVPS